jgi:putative addiction module killer protein
MAPYMLPSDLAIEAYADAAGRVPFRDWFEGLDAVAVARVTVALARIARGAVSNVKGVGQGVLEFRIDFGPGYRVYFGRDGDRLVILLAGGTKRRQDQDIAAAKVRWADYKARKVRAAREGEA